MKFIRKDERITIDKIKKKRSINKRFYKKFVKLIVNFQKFNNNYILKGKIDILKCGHKRENSLYILFFIYTQRLCVRFFMYLYV